MALPEIFHSESQQHRSEIGGIDLFPEKVQGFLAFLYSLGLQEFHPPILGYYATVYFIPVQTEYKLPATLRYRIYGVASERLPEFLISPGDVGVLELKHKPQRYPVRLEDKQREFCTATAVDELVKYLGAARVILDSHRPSVIPFGYPAGVISRESLAASSDSLFATGSLMPSLVIASNRRHFVADLQKPDALRITLDTDAQYLGYPPDTVSLFQPPEPIGRYSQNRVEIKLTVTDLESTGRKILDFGEQIGHQPPVRKTGFQTYFRRYLGVPDRRAIQPIFKTNEIPGREIEAKMTIASSHSTSEIAKLIYQTFDQGIDKYSIQGILRTIKESHTYAIRYGVLGASGRISEAFVITPRETRHQVGIKRKLQVVGIYGNIIDRTEEREYLSWPEWTPWAESSVIEQEATRLGVSPDRITRIGESTRLKLKVYTQNNATSRLYVVSLDESLDSRGRLLKQVEIEYGGRTGIHQQNIDGLTLPAIIKDIQTIQAMILSATEQLGVKWDLQLLTKFDWLNKITR